MGEEVKKVEEQKNEEPPVAVPDAQKKEDATETKGEEEKKKEEEAAKEPPPPPPPLILSIDLHCIGCANKIKRCILRCKGVEDVEVDMAQNQVMVKGIVDPQGICERLRKRTLRYATVISPPLPPPPTEVDTAASPMGEPVVVHSQVSEATTVELLVNMHCEACAQQLQKKILKMRGVQSADANSGAGKLTITGTMSADKLIQYIHRRTGKLTSIVPPQPPSKPPNQEDAKKEDVRKKPEEPPAEDADKEDQGKPLAEDAAEKKDSEGEHKQDEAAKVEDGAEKKQGSGIEKKAKPEVLAIDGFPPEEMMKRIMYWPYPHKHYYNPQQVDEESTMAKRMSMVHPYAMPLMQWMPPPPPPPLPPLPPASVASAMKYQYYNYGMVERSEPPPHYFSDENPNACVMS